MHCASTFIRVNDRMTCQGITDDIPDGTSLHPPGALPYAYTHDDEVAMRHFVDRFRGRGVVCTSMDKAETTLMFMCPKLYVDNLMTDLETGATYQPATLSHADLLHVHNEFCRHYGIPVDTNREALSQVGVRRFRV